MQGTENQALLLEQKAKSGTRIEFNFYCHIATKSCHVDVVSHGLLPQPHVC